MILRCSNNTAPVRDLEAVLADPETSSVDRKINIASAMDKAGIIDVNDQMMPVGENGLLISGPSSHESQYNRKGYVYLDVSKGEARSIEEMDFIDIPISNMVAFDGQAYVVNDSGVFAVDLDAEKYESALSYNFTNCNRYALNHSELVKASDDDFLFLYNRDLRSEDNSPIQALFDFRKGTYDRAGQKVITVAATDALDYQTSEAICRFNDSGNGYFALFDDRYCMTTTGNGLNEEDEVNDMKAYSDMSAGLTVDLLAGNGPDILLTRGANEYLSNDSVFIDLMPYISGFKDDEYFTNVFEASKTKGKLYQLPLNFCVEGLISSPDSFGGKAGLTFDEYEDLVETVCDNIDPMYAERIGFSRALTVEELFGISGDLFIKDGRIDVNNDEFKALLDYSATLPEKGVEIDINDSDAMIDLERSRRAMNVIRDRIGCFDDFGRYHDRYGQVEICGLPSPDGRSACIVSDRTVSIAAHSKSPDACAELIRILLFEDIQYLGADARAIPMNKNAMRTDARELMDIHNLMEEDFNYDYQPGVKYGDQLIDEFEKAVSAITTGTSIDNSILLIVYEESQPYLCGQKSFEDVSKVINDRAQTVLDERK